jgi:hypothetical protein
LNLLLEIFLIQIPILLGLNDLYFKPHLSGGGRVGAVS